MKTTLIHFYRTALSALLAGCILSACHNKDKTPNPTTTNYSSYNFADANYKQQTVVLLLVDSLLNNVEGLGDDGAQPISASSLNAIYDNTNHLFSNIDTGVSLSGLVNNNGVFFSDTLARAYFDSIEARSSNNNFLGVKGNDSANTISTGLYLPEYYEKYFMGSLIYYQANQIFSQISAADNTTIDAKYGTTDMIHLWDELFGYMGMPTDYPTWTYNQLDAGTKNLSDPTQQDFINSRTDFLFGEYIGRSTYDYTVFTNNPTDYIQKIFNAFYIGRVAIANKDYTTRDAQLVIIKDIWERIIASQAISYAYKCKSVYPNIGHPWSELSGFIHMFQYNSTNKLGNTNINLLYGYIGNKPAATDTTSLNNVITLLKTTYGY